MAILSDEQPAPPAMPEATPGETIQEDQQAVDEMASGLVQEDDAEISPSQQMQLDAYNDNATLVVYTAESQPAILQSLQTGKNPIDSIARTANLIHKRLQSSLEKEGEKMTEITMCLGAAHLVSELIVLADAAKLYQLNEQDRLEAYRHTIMQYFEAGLKDGSIDPVELQKTIEPLMNQDQRQAGLEQAEKNAILKTAPPSGKMNRSPQQPQQGGILGGGQ
jgi:hypothetical protein